MDLEKTLIEIKSEDTRWFMVRYSEITCDVHRCPLPAAAHLQLNRRGIPGGNSEFSYYDVCLEHYDLIKTEGKKS